MTPARPVWCPRLLTGWWLLVGLALLSGLRPAIAAAGGTSGSGRAAAASRPQPAGTGSDAGKAAGAASSRKSSSKGSNKGAPASSSADILTVLPLIPLGTAGPLSADLSGLLFAELKRYQGIDVHIRKPVKPVAADCLESVACLQQRAGWLETRQLLVGTANGHDDAVTVTLVLFDAGRGGALRRVSIDLTGKAERFGRMMRPVIDELATAAGGVLEADATTAGATTGGAASGVSSSGRAAAGATTGGAASGVSSSGRAAAGATGSPDLAQSASLEALIEALPPQEAGVLVDGRAETEDARDAKALDTAAAASSSEELEHVRKQEAARLKAQQAQDKKESEERDRQRRLELKAQQRRLEQEQKEAERARKLELREAQRRAKEEEKRRKAVEARRLENMERARQGLPPLPELELEASTADASGAVGEAKAGTGARGETAGHEKAARATAGATAKSGASAPDGRATTRDGGDAAVAAQAGGPPVKRTAARRRRLFARKQSETVAARPSAPEAEDVAGIGQEKGVGIVENDSPWQVGTFAGLAWFAGYGLVAGGLEGGFAPLPWLWIEAAAGSLSGNDATRDARFYLLEGRLGAVVRRANGPLHPYAGLDAVGLLIGPGALTPGLVARGGADIMLGEALGIRLEAAGGAAHSATLSDSTYQYPASTQVLLRLGLGLRWHF